MTTVELYTAAFTGGLWGGFALLATVEVALTIFESALRWMARWMRGKEEDGVVQDDTEF